MRKLFIFFILVLIIHSLSVPVYAENEHSWQDRMQLYDRMEALTQIHWYYFAAIDQYERSIRKQKQDRPEANDEIAIVIPPEKWAGSLNPNPEDTNPTSISFFGGMGLDGNGDGIADRSDAEDVLYTFSHYLQTYGSHKDDIKIALWDYYKRDQTVRIIMSNAAVYKHFGTINLQDNAFPLPLHHNYSYKNTWGDRRGWGGLRIHEGTDIFANYGVPVRATVYGTIETMGWNRFGGWRIGIRDLNNTYHYYAHLNGFEKNIARGEVVKPGDVIGYVGSSGYGPKGTAGKFPPHLHYGMYRDNGVTEWSFDPFPLLNAWEREDRKNNK